LVPPAVASSDAAMRALGRSWKKIQRLAYPAAVLTLIHWLLVHDGKTEALLHFAPLALLQLVRAARSFTPKSLERNIA
jgi:sulfoxide reductase heme-binding subunit YedZ